MQNQVSGERRKDGGKGQPAHALSIAELGLSTRPTNVLLNAGIRTAGDALAALSVGSETLIGLKGFGPQSLAALVVRLQERGFPVPGEEALVSIDGRSEEAASEEETLESETISPEVSGDSPSPGQQAEAPAAQSRDRFRVKMWFYCVIGAAVVLLLVSASLIGRLSRNGYGTLSASSSSVSHGDGLTMSVNPDAFSGRMRVRIDTVPQLEFLEGSAGGTLRKAVEALPSHLMAKSPVYQVKARGETSESVMIDVVMPNDAEPWETLDLYTWTGDAWEWVGSELHTEVAEHEFIRAEVREAPATLVVMQTDVVGLDVSATWEIGDNAVASGAGVVDEVNPVGLLLGTEGGFVGDVEGMVQPMAGESYEVVPTVRNWAPDGAVNRGLLSDVLTMEVIREQHIANLVGMCRERGYGGIEIDYRGVGEEEREAYGEFIGALAEGMHKEGLRLNVVVEAAEATNGGWETGGYDWRKLGAEVDVVKVPFPEDPGVYVEGGQAERLLEWATSQVDRYKLRMMVSSLSAERSEGEVRAITMEEALAPFGEVMMIKPSEGEAVEFGGEAEFGLSGRVKSITMQEGGGTYRVEYEGEGGESRTVWLGTAANLGTKLRWATRYHLGGVAIVDLLDGGNGPGMMEVVASEGSVASGAEGQGMEVVWTVESETATIDQQRTSLTTPEYTWMVLASEGEYTVKARIGGYEHGAVRVMVGQPQPEVAEVIAPDEADTAPEQPAADEPVAQPSETPVDANCLDASYAADVTIPDDSQLENGEEFVKTWRVRNSGSCAWPEDTVIAFVGETQMDGPESVAVGALEPGGQADVSVNMKAPADSGRYTGVWQMKSGEDLFGGKLTVVIRAGDVAESPATAPIIAPISGGSFELGGHIRDVGLPYADTMHYTGMNWAKVQVHYGQDASGIVAAAHSRGFKIQLSALGSPNMVTRGGFEQDYANWVAQLAAAGADAIEVWNEPNIDREWQIGHISPQAYTNLLCASYNAIKAANANVAVISAAPAPTGFFGGCGPNGCDDAPWMAGLSSAGAGNCMDYIGAHHNSGATSPSARIGHPANPGDTHHSWFFLPQTEMYYNTFGGARKLFYTEMGYASQEGVPTFDDAFGWARGTNNAQQAAWLAEAVQLSVNTGMVRCIIVWNIDFVRYGYDPQDGYAIIRPGGGCPACDSLHNVLGTR